MQPLGELLEVLVRIRFELHRPIGDVGEDLRVELLGGLLRFLVPPPPVPVRPDELVTAELVLGRHVSRRSRAAFGGRFSGSALLALALLDHRGVLRP